MSQDEFYFPGFRYPRYTQVPDEVFDVLLPHLREAELKALLYIIRRTFGFKKECDAISFNQFLRGITTKDGRVLDHGCGLRDRTTLSNALKSLEEKGIIISEKRVSEEGGNEPTVYRLHFFEGVVGNSYYPSRESLPPLVGNSYPQQTVQQKTEKQQTEVVVVEKLTEMKIEGNKSRELASKYTREQIEEKLEFLKWKLKLQNSGRQRRGRPITDPAGWLIRAIEKDYKPPKAFFEYKQRVEESVELAEEWEEQPQILSEFESLQQDSQLAQLMEQYGTSPQEFDLWKSVLEELRLQMTRSSFDNRLASTHLLALDNGKAVIGVSNKFTLDWLQHRLASKVGQVLEGFVEDDSVELEFVVIRSDERARND